MSAEIRLLVGLPPTVFVTLLACVGMFQAGWVIGAMVLPPIFGAALLTWWVCQRGSHAKS